MNNYIVPVHEVRIDGLTSITCSRHVVSFELGSAPIGPGPSDHADPAFRACMDMDDFFAFVADMQGHAEKIREQVATNENKKIIASKKNDSSNEKDGFSVEATNETGERIT